MPRSTKTAQVQIRVTAGQKRELVRQARQAGLDLSAWVLGRLLPARRAAFKRLVGALAGESDLSYVFAELADLLSNLGRGEFPSVVESLPSVELGDMRANQLAAMVETVATRHGVRPPAWVDAIAPLSTPWFPTALTSLRLHLLCNAPAAFRRRNLFADSTLEQRV